MDIKKLALFSETRQRVRVLAQSGNLKIIKGHTQDKVQVPAKTNVFDRGGSSTTAVVVLMYNRTAIYHKSFNTTIYYDKQSTKNQGNLITI